ncbi:helicase C-terminal domain-containing protein [Zhaonella formicivorans]|uniref:helicase C-terminal domain-containing protein n=1 Tax=Zhaonella formicivorans TaxID=2528593 RepID=UPI0010F421D7|nr:helicase C-terminal domain-containing protein [Zhaonella formicivorans]
MESFVALDIETTGLQPECDEIIEVAAVKFKKGQIESKFSSLIYTSKSLSPYLTKLTGITQEMLSHAPAAQTVLEELKTFIGTDTLVLHNAPFDLSFLTKLNQGVLANEYLDTLDLAKIVLPTLGSYRLQQLAEHFNLPIPTHRASVDAEACGYIFLEIVKIFASTPLAVLNHYINLFSKPPSSFGHLLQKIYLQKLNSNGLGNVSPEFNFINKPLHKGIFAEVRKDSKQQTINFNLQEIKSLVSEEGNFASRYPGFEFRQSQSKMLGQICESFINEKFLVLEAATGTGKSLAYLIPAIFWALHKKEKVIISTHTINLQEQLLFKELPILQKVLDISFASAIIKGRNNYICLYKWQEKLQNSFELSNREKYFLARIISWLQNSLTGDKNELNLSSNEQDLWSKVAADSYSCLGKICPWFDCCFVMEARKKAEQADIVITNHSLLLTDAKIENGILPKHRYLIIDEAHNLEQEATNHLTTEFSSYKIQQLIFNLFHHQDKRPAGMLAGLGKELKIIKDDKRDSAETTLAAAIDHLLALAHVMEDLTKALKVFNTSTLPNSEYNAKWLKTEIYDSPDWPAVKTAAENVIMHLRVLADNLVVLARFSEEELEDPVQARNLLAYAALCKEYQDNLNFLFNLESRDFVTWLETDNDNNKFHFALKSTPIEVGPLLYELVFKEKQSVILTSATLTVEQDFSYFIQQVGLNLLPAERIITTIIESSYNLAEQALLCIVNNLPNPAQVDEAKFAQEIQPVLSKLILANKGRTLVLFTSHRLLRQVYYALKDDLERHKIQLLGHQIDGSRTYLVEEFKKAEQAVLFGANSFWEGVDVPGDALTLIIIVKLPFQAPTQPALAARIEYLKSKCQDPFTSLNLPQAIIKFKQGFGRLIRTSTDKGIVVVLDRRIIEKNYGRKFLNSLPLKTHFRGTVSEIVKFIIDAEQISKHY